MTAIDLYWITRLDALKNLVGFVQLLLFIFPWFYLGLKCFSYPKQQNNWNVKNPPYEEDDEYRIRLCTTYWPKVFIKFFLMFIPSAVLYVIQSLIPDTKEMLIIQGIDKITQSPEINNLVGLIYEKLQTLLMSK